ncbi:MAG: hypothetical protein AB7U38_04105 [Hyphomicrobiales bacterium]
MTQRKRRWLWTTVGAVALLPPAHGVEAANPSPDASARTTQQGQAAAPQHWKMAAGEKGEAGEAGEAGGGGESGERGVDPARAAKDPVAFITALEVIRAHYLAGKAAYAAGDRDAAAEMFVHPIGEVYVDLEDVFKQRGVQPFDELMSKAGELGGGTDAKAVNATVDQVLAAIDAAAEKAPAPGPKDARTNALILADLIDRAAALYVQAEKETEGEAYLDGYGFYQAASTRAKKQLESISSKNPDLAKDINAALDQLAKAYPSAKRPGTLAAKSSDVLAASSRVALGAGGVH